MSRKQQRQSLRLVDTMRSCLSAPAVAVLEAMDIHRSPEWTVSQDVLRQMLERRGLPVYESALNIERIAGGAEMDPGSYLGVFASLRSLEARPPLGRGEVDWGGEAPRRYKLEHLPHTDHRPLLRLLSARARFGEPEIWVGQHGVISIVDPDDDVGGAFPAFDTFAQYMEVFALLGGALPPVEQQKLRRHRIWIAGLAGEALSAELDAWSFSPATGSCCTAWQNEEVSILEQRIPGFPEGTHVIATDVNAAVAALRAAFDAQHRDVRWWSPAHKPLARSGLTLAGPPPGYAHSDGWDIYTWGTLVDPYYRPRP